MLTFYPRPVWHSGIVTVCVFVCPYVRVCVNPELVRAITCDASKPGSPTLDHKCKTICKDPYYVGAIGLDKKRSNFMLKSQFLRAKINH